MKRVRADIFPKNSVRMIQEKNAAEVVPYALDFKQALHDIGSA